MKRKTLHEVSDWAVVFLATSFAMQLLGETHLIFCSSVFPFIEQKQEFNFCSSKMTNLGIRYDKVHPKTVCKLLHNKKIVLLDGGTSAFGNITARLLVLSIH